MAYQPPLQLTHTMTIRMAEISERIGAWKAVNKGALEPELQVAIVLKPFRPHWR
jgi:hypothetical protein